MHSEEIDRIRAELYEPVVALQKKWQEEDPPELQLTLRRYDFVALLDETWGNLLGVGKEFKGIVDEQDITEIKAARRILKRLRAKFLRTPEQYAEYDNIRTIVRDRQDQLTAAEKTFDEEAEKQTKAYLDTVGEDWVDFHSQ